jgi:hypothetical protein
MAAGCGTPSHGRSPATNPGLTGLAGQIHHVSVRLTYVTKSSRPVPLFLRDRGFDEKIGATMGMRFYIHEAAPCGTPGAWSCSNRSGGTGTTGAPFHVQLAIRGPAAVDLQLRGAGKPT